MGSFCTFGVMAHFGTFRHILGHIGAYWGIADRRDPTRELGSFCAIAISVAPGCTTLHGVVPGCTRVRVRLSKNSRLRLRGATRVGPRSRKREGTRKTARLLLHPNRARS